MSAGVALLGLEDPLPGWLSHVSFKLVLVVGWELCWNCPLGRGVGVGTSVLLCMGLATLPLGLSHGIVAGKLPVLTKVRLRSGTASVCQILLVMQLQNSPGSRGWRSRTPHLVGGMASAHRERRN